MRLLADRDQVGVQRRRGDRARGLHEFDQTFDPECEPDGRGVAPAQLRDESVIAATGTDRALGAQIVGNPLKDGPVIIVQSAHQAWVDLIGDADGIQSGQNCREMSARGLTQAVHEARRGGGDGLRLGALGVEHP